ncbi:MAG: hypothetical protein QOH83_815 [Solirubrobacteraceae bacterium]|jgi:hypothetical protein|nr:hypothetical protein [Solirubrobacteraceae bacterium]
MTDPTNARMRTLHRFFNSPRFPIKELPGVDVDGRHEDDEDDGRGPRGTELPAWNAYVGAPR